MNTTLLKLKINFGATLIPFETPIEDYIIGVVQKILGKENKWHDKFSNYNISGMFGGIINNNQCIFKNGGYFYISSIDEELQETATQETEKDIDGSNSDSDGESSVQASSTENIISKESASSNSSLAVIESEGNSEQAEDTKENDSASSESATQDGDDTM